MADQISASDGWIDDKTLFEAQKQAVSLEEAERIGAIRLQFANQRLQAAAKSFIDGSLTYLDLIGQLEKGIRQIGHAPELAILLQKARELQIALHQREHAQGSDQDDNDDDVKQDEESNPPDVGGKKKAPATRRILRPPETLTTTDFHPELAREYEKLFLGSVIREERQHLVARSALAALESRSRYEHVGRLTGIPWWFIAGIHMLESQFNFGAHLHNGDSLSARTRRVPKGRPQTGAPPFTWEESALDALNAKKLASLGDWSLARALYRWERYNGVGYRARKIPSPYLWSFSTVYAKGKFIRDHTFDENAVSQQCGAAVLLKYLHERGELQLDFDDQEETSSFDPSEDIGGAVLDTDTSTDLSPFAAFWRQNLSEIMHFKPREFLYKGTKHASNGLNTDPPDRLWPNVISLVRVLDQVRSLINQPVKLISVYRSPAYNKSVGGASKSEHMNFTAADFTVSGAGSGPEDWARVVHGLRARKLFSGGIGVYPAQNFVHVDVRGYNANW
ncbi:D-Ala-D-Ala carboxypeptidase family metallohydrolase [Bosea sp. NPDC003192]|uniref:D-Ala-D-Ala carboxypeptidase family metallohydrolase n=1 Tax=Bosea sp. NPDC003192 TaxID=3390551 RepID=UPI003CFC35D2